jgi:adenylate cyclase
MEFELERKYLLERLPENLGDPVLIQQGYLYTDPFEFRVRKKGALCFMTYKSAGYEERVEWEREIPDWLYDELITKRAGYLIVKNRYTVERDGHIFEIDEYLNEFDRSIIAEIEFMSRDEFDLFSPPVWLGQTREVTYDPDYKNKSFATKDRDGPKNAS